jgi:uncharacterized protein (DUF2336 family)
VDAAGKVTARAVGEALIHATVMGVVGEGRVVVPAPLAPERVMFDLVRVQGQALPGPVFERMRGDGKVNVQVLGGSLKADPFGEGSTAHYEIAILPDHRPRRRVDRQRAVLRRGDGRAHGGRLHLPLLGDGQLQLPGAGAGRRTPS